MEWCDVLLPFQPHHLDKVVKVRGVLLCGP